MELKELFREAKRQFFAMRNGDIAAQMRARGATYKINFGLNLPQVVEIAKQLKAQCHSSEQQKELAQSLWDNATTRESRLIAPMLLPNELADGDTALRWALEAQTPEVADVLCHRLLRQLAFASSLADQLVKSPSEQQRYTGLRLILNLLILGRYPLDVALSKAQAEAAANIPMTASLCRQILAEGEN